ncbi:RRQRL motif-containing zinc-binding protein (plasmid) [Streptomyces sp. SDT5-1]|uniref:RRQRL motif-containing zinc-binding protein n=1 Tax=Streptomyces sp. SDT5-1 TaxID=3406418 RepID=UPI003FD4EB0D
MPRAQKKPRRAASVLRGAAALPEYDHRTMPEGLATRRQLRDMGLSPGANEGPVAILRCKLCATRPHRSCTHPTRGFLLRIDLARPKRTPTLAQEEALDRAMAKRQTCPKCERRYYHCLPLRTLGHCDPCERGYQPSPDTVMHDPRPADRHRLAA